MNLQNRTDRRAGRPYMSAPNTITFPKPLRARSHRHIHLDREEQREWQANQREIYGDARLGRQLGRERAQALHRAAVARLIAVIEHHEHVAALTAVDLDAAFAPLADAARPLTTSGVALRGPDTSAPSITPLVTTRPALLTL